MSDSDNLSPEERAKAMKMGQDALVLAASAMPFAILKAIGWLLLGAAAFIVAAKYVGWI
jgi:hypothetical protein